MVNTLKIVSLLPSATEIVCGLGLRDQLVGVTHECDYPSDVSDLPKVTRTVIPKDASSVEIDSLVRDRLKTQQALYSLDAAVMRALEPDLIVTQALCDVCAVAESEVTSVASSLPSKPRVINMEPSSLGEVLDCISHVAEAAGVREEGNRYVQELQSRIDRISTRSLGIRDKPSVLLLEWIDPPFSAGHWSPDLVSRAGGREAIGIAGQRSITTSWDTIRDADPEVMVLACCGFNVERTMQDLPILKSYSGWQELRCVKNQRVYVIDGSAYFSRPGPRLVDSLEILASALHPGVHDLPRNLMPATPLNAIDTLKDV